MIKYYKFINYGTLAAVILLAVLMLFELVPSDWFIPMLVAAIILLIIRIAARVFVSTYYKNTDKGE